ncbi:MAG: glycosyltransferase family 39 protein [Gemmatimonadota bacterium]|nr:glycosyltransferase family 39 protein [Gemmatimonadota bacterium]
MSRTAALDRFDRWITRRRRPLGWAVFAFVLTLLTATLTAPGITWDEPHYFLSAQLQVKWVETLLEEGPSGALDREKIREMWDWRHYHNPHPPLYKEGMALTWWTTRGWLGPLAGYRLFPALCFALLVAVAFRWGTAAWSGIGGFGAAASILLMPRLFGHAHLGATETPLMVAWTVVAASAWWAVERERAAGWIVAGIAWGFAAGTKFSGIAAFAPVLLWALWRDRQAALRGAALATGVATVFFVGTNPLVWAGPAEFFGTWFWESLHRADYAPIPTFYLGNRYGFDVPWHHVFVMTMAVTPLPILAMAALGAVFGAERLEPAAVLAAGSVVFVWTMMLVPGAPHHNGVRQFVSLFPFLGMLAGYGLYRACESLDGVPFALVTALVFAPPSVQLVRSHPYYLEYYGEAVGGVPGAHRLGFETTYWMDVVTDDVLHWMNRNLPRNATVLVHGAPMTLQFARAYGRVRDDLEFVGHDDGAEAAGYFLVPMSQFSLGPTLQRAVERGEPLYELTHRGVRLLAIYRLEPQGDRS